MKHYFFRLIPSRSSFPADITPAEAELMREHRVYWSGLIAQGLVHAVGPVFDPKGAFGVAIASLSDDADPQAVGTADPVVKAGIGFRYEVLPMPALLLPQKPAG